MHNLDTTVLVSLSLIVKGGDQNGRPRPQVVIPSAAYGGAIISFILCPSELVKVDRSFIMMYLFLVFFLLFSC